MSGVNGTRISLTDMVTAEPSELEADLLVVRSRLAPNGALLHDLDGEVPALVSIGDCSAARRLSHAVLDANMALRRFDAGLLQSSPMVAF